MRLRREHGQTFAEYALILGGIAIVVILAIVFLGGKVNDLFRSTGVPTVRTTLARIDKTIDNQPAASVWITWPSQALRRGDAVDTRLVIRVLPKRVTKAPVGSDGRIRVSPRLLATLRGVGFTIDPLGPGRQVLSARDPTTWRWSVEPTETGSRVLHLSISALLGVEGETTTRAIQTFDHPVDVREPPKTLLAELSRWDWIGIGTLLVGIAGAVAGWRRSRPPSADGQGSKPQAHRPDQQEAPGAGDATEPSRISGGTALPSRTEPSAPREHDPGSEP